jgi:hypothetical protein
MLAISEASTKRVEMTQKPRQEVFFREAAALLVVFLGRLKPKFLWVFQRRS